MRTWTIAHRAFASNTAITPGLQRITDLLSTTPLPWKAVHVAGTNGKGSICNYISGMIDEYNRSTYRLKMRQPEVRHGRFTSPHLIDRWDCITIDNRPIDQSLFLELENAIKARSESESVNASPFEILTATAFTAFTEARLDLAVVEVGMGGREDATNIVGQDSTSHPSKYILQNGEALEVPSIATFRPQPLVTAIAKIGSDHQDFLGSDLRSIAAHKAGIIKPRSPFVYDTSNSPETIEVINQQQNYIGHAEWPRLFHDASILDSIERVFTNADYNSQSDHIRFNAAVAVRSAWMALARLGNRVPVHDGTLLQYSSREERTTRQAQPTSSSSTWTEDLHDLLLEMLHVPLRTVVPGRQERVDLHKITGIRCPALLDGAHNEQSTKALAAEIEQLRTSSKTFDQTERSDQETKAGLRAESPVCLAPSGSGPSGKITYVLAFSGSKSDAIVSMLQQILRPGDEVHAVEFATPVDGMPWVQPARSSEIMQKAEALVNRPGEMRDWRGDVEGALKHVAAKWRDGTSGEIVITGSLYLVGDVHRMMRRTTETD